MQICSPRNKGERGTCHQGNKKCAAYGLQRGHQTSALTKIDERLVVTASKTKPELGTCSLTVNFIRGGVSQQPTPIPRPLGSGDSLGSLRPQIKASATKIRVQKPTTQNSAGPRSFADRLSKHVLPGGVHHSHRGRPSP